MVNFMVRNIDKRRFLASKSALERQNEEPM